MGHRERMNVVFCTRCARCIGGCEIGSEFGLGAVVLMFCHEILGWTEVVVVLPAIDLYTIEGALN
jgi:hypothetical protein